MAWDYKNVSESKVGLKAKPRAKGKNPAKKAARKSSKKSTKELHSQGLPVWFWLVSGVSIGGFVSFLIYIKLNVDVDPEVSQIVKEKIETNFAKPEQSREKKHEVIEDEKSRFEFYSILPERNITIPDEIEGEKSERVSEKTPVKTSEKTSKEKSVNEPPVKHKVVKIPDVNKNTASTENSAEKHKNRFYVLQVGSFNQFKDADKRKANLALMGVMSKIYSITFADKIMYRVRVGPYANLIKINEIASTLEQNKIPSLLMKVKG